MTRSDKWKAALKAEQAKAAQPEECMRRVRTKSTLGSLLRHGAEKSPYERGDLIWVAGNGELSVRVSGSKFYAVRGWHIKAKPLTPGGILHFDDFYVEETQSKIRETVAQVEARMKAAADGATQNTRPWASGASQQGASAAGDAAAPAAADGGGAAQDAAAGARGGAAPTAAPVVPPNATDMSDDEGEGGSAMSKRPAGPSAQSQSGDEGLSDLELFFV